MATTTPNFGWDIPQSTDLVKDGATAIAALGTDIDTALVDLKGGTTGQVLSKASNTDLDFTWTADASGIPATIFDAKGDIIAASAADTAARLAVGTNGQVLTADSTTSTGLKWATAAGASASFSLLNAGGTTLTGSSVTISGISNQESLLIRVVSVDTSTASVIVSFRINSNSGSIYSGSGIRWLQTNNASTTERWNETNGAQLPLFNNGNAGAISHGTALIQGAKGSGLKLVQVTGAGPTDSASAAYAYHGIIDDTNAITSITVRVDSGTFDSGTVFVYGSAN